eukprot:SAG11_NODE_6627_length_1277_cov_1.256367_2_plen_123_part_00
MSADQMCWTDNSTGDGAVLLWRGGQSRSEAFEHRNAKQLHILRPRSVKLQTRLLAVEFDAAARVLGEDLFFLPNRLLITHPNTSTNNSFGRQSNRKEKKKLLAYTELEPWQCMDERLDGSYL